MLQRVFITLFLFISVKATAQESQPVSDPFSISPMVYFGKVWKHTVNFYPTINGPATAFEVDFQKQTMGNKYWQRVYHCPQYGIAVSAIRYNNDSVLGYGFGIMPYLQLPLLTGKHIDILFRMGSGIAYLNKRYNAVTDTNNDVISTHFNDITSFTFRVKWEVNPYSSFLLGASFTHYSVGATRLPNLGINVPMANISYSYTFNPYLEDRSKIPVPEKEEKPKQFYFRNKLVMSRFESLIGNGPLYSQYGTEMAVGKYLATWNKLFLNAELFYNTFTYYYLLNQEIAVGNQMVSSLGATVAIEDEVLFNHVGLTGAVGYVLYQPYFSGYPYFEKLGVQYHFFIWGDKKSRNLFVGIYLKTHLEDAEHVEAGLGVEW